MKILITGGAGFIGSHIVDDLIKNHEIITIDNLSTGNKKNLNQKVKFYNTNISQDLNKIFSEEKPEILIHTAAQINLRKSIKNPISDANQNIIASLNLLEMCRKFNIKKIIYSASGGSRYGIIDETASENNLPNPISPYAISKHTVEHYLDFYNKVYGIKTISLAYSNIYGPRQDSFGEAGVISIFTNQMLNNQTPKIFGDGNQTRDFLFIKDVAEANLKAVIYNKSGLFNISTGIKTSINKIYSLLKEFTNYKGDIIYDKPIKGEAKHSCIDPSKAMKELKWIPKTTLKQGLKQTVDYFTT